jgi:hypothetical protein
MGGGRVKKFSPTQPARAATAYISCNRHARRAGDRTTDLRQATHRSFKRKVVAGEFPDEETVRMYLSASPHPKVFTPAIRGVQLLFQPTVSMREVQDTLELARLAAESLCGPERMEVDTHWEVHVAGKRVCIDTATEAGRTLAIVFLGLVKREFGSDAVRVLGARTGVAS